MKAIFFANTDWYLYNFRLPLARELRSRGVEVVLVSPPGPHGAKLQAQGFRWRPIEMERRSLHPTRELALILRLAALFRSEQPDLVHNFTIKCVVYGGLAAKSARVPARVNAVAGFGYVFTNDELMARALRPVVRSLLRPVLGGAKSRLILQNTDDIAAFRTARLVDDANVRLVRGSGVDLSRFSPGVDAPLTRTPPRIILAARLLWDKGVGEYVEVARRIRASGVPARFLLAGAPDDGNPASIPKSALERWADEGVIEVLGQVDDMPALLAESDIAVLPSYREGLPKGLIEAAACALPIVATDVPGCREVVTHERDGLLVPAREVDGLERAIRRLIDEPDFARGLGTRARAKALAHFDQEIVHRQTLDVYRELVGAI